MWKELGLVALTLISLSPVDCLTIGPTADLVISNKNIAPDGVFRSAVLAGGTFPGPVITGRKGDRFRLNVVNQLHDTSMVTSTTVHWHGIFQRRTNFADGTASITQCPILPGNSFLYEFGVPEQAGTFWYHSHVSTQYCDGLRGAFIVYDPDCPYKALYDIDDGRFSLRNRDFNAKKVIESTIITLADWFPGPAKSIRIKGDVFPTPTTLINGKGRRSSGPLVPLSIINVRSRKRYRFRIIAMSCDPSFTFWIDGHSLMIIEADGEYTEPLVVDSFAIHAGQRYSAILTANQPIGNYWIRANPLSGEAEFDGGRNSAILRYAGALEVEPTSMSTPVNPLKEVNLHSLRNPQPPGLPIPGGADHVLHLEMTLNFKSLQFVINGVQYSPPTTPVLLQILSGVRDAQELLPQGAVYSLPPNKVIEISMHDAKGPHPFHLHGHSFYVVRSGDSDTYNYMNPVQRDTVNTGTANTTIRFVTDNAGPWFLHCHIDWHLELGLAVVLAEDIPDIAHENPVPEAWKQLCLNG